jgi:hypothetical protein
MKPRVGTKKQDYPRGLQKKSDPTETKPKTSRARNPARPKAGGKGGLARYCPSTRWARLIARTFGHGHRAVRGGGHFKVVGKRALADNCLHTDVVAGRGGGDGAPTHAKAMGGAFFFTWNKVLALTELLKVELACKTSQRHLTRAAKSSFISSVCVP